MLDFLKGVLLGLIPPDGNADPHLILKWRLNVSITLGVLVMSTTTGFALSFGFLTFIFPGFALASDVSQTKALITQVLVAQLDNQIFTTKQNECLAIANKNRDLAVSYEQRVQSLLPQYQRLNNGQPYQFQPCP